MFLGRIPGPAIDRTGFALLASNSVQEAQDMAAIASAATLAGRWDEHISNRVLAAMAPGRRRAIIARQPGPPCIAGSTTGVAFNHVVELVVPFFYFTPAPLSSMSTAA